MTLSKKSSPSLWTPWVRTTTAFFSFTLPNWFRNCYNIQFHFFHKGNIQFSAYKLQKSFLVFFNVLIHFVFWNEKTLQGMNMIWIKLHVRVARCLESSTSTGYFHFLVTDIATGTGHQLWIPGTSYNVGVSFLHIQICWFPMWSGKFAKQILDVRCFWTCSLSRISHFVFSGITWWTFDFYVRTTTIWIFIKYFNIL